MDLHSHQEYATHKDLNGFGKRVNEIEGDTRENTVRSIRNEGDITKCFELAGENTQSINGLEKTVAGLVGKVAGAVAVITAVIATLSEVIKHFVK